MAVTWEYRTEDQEFFERELDAFVPDRIYDMHAHLWRATDWGNSPPDIVRLAPSEITLEIYREHLGWIFPNRDVHGLHFPFPSAFPNNPAPCNEWIAAQIREDSLARGQFYVRPDDDPDWVASETKRLGLRGFKPFSCFSARQDKENAEIPEYFPEWIARIANDNGYSVTLHMMRARSLADSSNQHWIRSYCTTYPNMTLILDHCARGFNPHHLLEGLPKVAGLPNLFVDVSVACSPLSIIACLSHLGPDHVLYGSDFFCSHQRGTNLPIGDSFMWLEEGDSLSGGVQYGKRPVLVGLENLRAVKAACRVLKLTDAQVEALFWNNAARILDLRRESA